MHFALTNAPSQHRVHHLEQQGMWMRVGKMATINSYPSSRRKPGEDGQAEERPEEAEQPERPEEESNAMQTKTKQTIGHGRY